MLKTRQWLVILGLLSLVILAVMGLVLTSDSGSSVARRRPRRAPLVDEQPVQTARNVAALASTREERRFAVQALRLADHAVDLAFADAMREATLRPATITPETEKLLARVRGADAQVKSDQELIDELQKSAPKAKTPAQDIQKQLDLLAAQMELDKDELDDAQGDLVRSGADPLSRIQRQFARYQATQKQSEAAQAQLVLPPEEASSTSRNLIAHFKAWRAENAKAALLQRARDEALQKHEDLQKKHDALESVPSESQGGQAQEASSADTNSDEAVIASLRRLSDRRKNLADLDKRIQDHQDLADVYGNWMAVTKAGELAAIHGIIRSILLVVLVVLGIYLADRAVDHFFAHLAPDRRRLMTLRMVVRFVVQAVGVLIILFVLFGVPNQMPTILGLAGAGLTVALKDFIVAFFGWFALMGRNGIRVGDWVEIQGVVGEVAEIGLLRTVLLETGNWTDAGQPTGRKVAFINSFAIEGHYFNFSTTGQWLWDELQILVPTAQSPYPVIDAIQELVTATTEANARIAEEEWQRATQRDRLRTVSAAPSIHLRPTNSGVEIHVRYITRAKERYATRTRLYQEIVALLHQRQPEPATAGAERRS